MKKFITVIAVILFLCCVFSACSTGTQPAAPKIANPLDANVLKAGVRNDAPGFGYFSLEKDEITGYEADIVHAIGDALGKQVELVVVNDETRETMLANGDIDLIAATYTITSEREQQFDFSVPYYTDHLVVLAPKASDIRSFADLNGKKVGTVANTTPAAELENTAKSVGVTIEPVLYDDFSQAKKALKDGSTDALFMDLSIATGYAGGEYTILSDRYAPQQYGIATRKADTDFSEKINGSISDLQSSGKLSEFMDHWELEHQETE